MSYYVKKPKKKAGKRRLGDWEILEKEDWNIDKDWEKMKVGDTYHDCVSFHEMDFLYEFGKGKHSVYENNKFYYDHVDKREFWYEPTPKDLEMTFEEWWQ